VLATGAGLWLTSGSGGHHGKAAGDAGSSTAGSSAPVGSSATAALQRPEGPALPDDVLLWAATRNGVEQIWEVKADSQNPQAFLAGGHSRSPALSHDRKTIAYIDDSGPQRLLHLIGTDGKGDRPLFKTPPARCAQVPGRPAFSPDDTQLAVICGAASDPENVSVYLVDVSGRIVSGPLDTGNMGDPTYRPDGGAVAYWKSGTVDGKQNVAIFEVNTNGAPRPQRLSGWVNANDPTFSPTGTSLALSALEGTTRQIAVINLANNAMTMLTTDRRSNQDPSWAPDGTQITYKSGPPLNPDIWVMDAKGTDQHALITDPGQDSAPAWSAR
jgi:Tol biopolymer transport system component